MNASNIKHVWFDLAGTLYTETPEFSAAHDAFRYRIYANLKGIDDGDAAKAEFLELYRQHGSNSAVFRSLGQPSDYWMTKLDTFDFTAHLQPDTNVCDALAQIKSVIPISLFTNFTMPKINAILKHLEIPVDFFTHVISGEDIAERKPALDGFYEMVERSNVASSEILYIGDRVDVDIKPAKQVGIQTCLIYGCSDETDYCIDDITELASLLSIR